MLENEVNSLLDQNISTIEIRDRVYMDKATILGASLKDFMDPSSEEQSIKITFINCHFKKGLEVIESSGLEELTLSDCIVDESFLILACDTNILSVPGTIFNGYFRYEPTCRQAYLYVAWATFNGPVWLLEDPACITADPKNAELFHYASPKTRLFIEKNRNWPKIHDDFK